MFSNVIHVYITYQQKDADPEKKYPHRAHLFIHTHKPKTCKNKIINAHVVHLQVSPLVFEFDILYILIIYIVFLGGVKGYYG